MADVFLDPARLGKWRGLCRSDPERVLRVFHLYPPHAKSPEGDTGDEVVAMMRALQEIAVGQGVSGKPDPAWKDLVEAGIIEELCNSVQTLVMDVKPKTPMGVPKEISEVVAKEVCRSPHIPDLSTSLVNNIRGLGEFAQIIPDARDRSQSQYHFLLSRVHPHAFCHSRSSMMQPFTSLNRLAPLTKGCCLP